MKCTLFINHLDEQLYISHLLTSLRPSGGCGIPIPHTGAFYYSLFLHYLMIIKAEITRYSKKNWKTPKFDGLQWIG
jgi:hypothetical protein